MEFSEHPKLVTSSQFSEVPVSDPEFQVDPPAASAPVLAACSKQKARRKITDLMDHHFAESIPALPVIQRVRREVFENDGAQDDEEPDAKMAKVDEPLAEATEPYPLEEPCYQRVGKAANSIYSGVALAPPLREIH